MLNENAEVPSTSWSGWRRLEQLGQQEILNWKYLMTRPTPEDYDISKNFPN